MSSPPPATAPSIPPRSTAERASTGIEGLDEILGGGLPTNHLYLSLIHI